MLPAVIFLLLLFVYPFLYGLVLSFKPKAGGAFANYSRFFSDPFLYETIATTLWLALPVTLLKLLLRRADRLPGPADAAPAPADDASWSCRSRSAPCWWPRGC